MSDHPYNKHREQQVAHRRVGTILNGSPSGAQQHSKGSAFSKITSKSAAVSSDSISGRSSAKRYARGGKVKKADGGPTRISKTLASMPHETEGERADREAQQQTYRLQNDLLAWDDAKNPGKYAGTDKNRGGGAFKRGGGVKKAGGHGTNIAIVVPGAKGGPPPGGPGGAPPMPPGGPPMAGAPGLPPGLPPPGPGGPPPMRAKGGRVKAGAESGVGRLQKAKKAK